MEISRFNNINFFKTVKLIFILSILSLNVFTTYSQNNISLEGNKLVYNNERTRVIVIGANSYKYWNPLSFAENDANEFYNFLLNNLKSNDPLAFKIFLKEEINSSNIVNYVKKIIVDTANFDRIVFYFAGHGTTQKNDASQKEGFLVMPEASADLDLWSQDAIASSDLLPRLSSLGEKKKIYVILDACNTGSFSNSSFLNTSVYNSINLVVSCQKGENSHEYPEINHGVFTYFLLEGLKGYADNLDFNGKVSLNELEIYLRQNIKLYIKSLHKPHIQTPIIRAPDINDEIINSDPDVLSSMKKKSGMNIKFNDISLDNNFSDTTLGINYEIFKEYLKDGKIIKPEGNCAFDLFLELNDRFPDEYITKDMQYLLNTILQNTGQKMINSYLRGEQTSNLDSVELASSFLEKSLTIIDKTDSYYKKISVMQMFLHAVTIQQDSLDRALSLLENALVLMPSAAYICNEVGHLYFVSMEYEKAEKKFARALDYTPTWKTPNYNIGVLYIKWNNQFEKALFYLNNAIRLDSTYVNALHARGKIYFEKKKYKKALNDFNKVVYLEPELRDDLEIFIEESKRMLKKND